MRLAAVVCLVASAAFPTLSRAQAPVFAITPETPRRGDCRPPSEASQRPSGDLSNSQSGFRIFFIVAKSGEIS
jgi:hypothetical protein